MIIKNHTVKNDSKSQETDRWHQIYSGGSLSRRRRNSMPNKLSLLGVTKASTETAILDTCCGKGETLEALHHMGFRNLHGVDIYIPPSLKSDERYHVVEADATMTPFPDNHFDLILNIHALHHLSDPDKISSFMNECNRILKPGGKLCIIDFLNGLPFKAAFWWFRQRRMLWNDYLVDFANLIEEERPLLELYIKNWPTVKKIILDGSFKLIHRKRDLFYFYLQLKARKDNQY